LRSGGPANWTRSERHHLAKDQRRRFRVLYAEGLRSGSKTYRLMPSYGAHIAPGENGKSTMTLLDFSRSRTLRGHPPPSTAVVAPQSTLQRTALGLARTSLVSMGIGIGVLMLRFGLVLMHGVLH